MKEDDLLIHTCIVANLYLRRITNQPVFLKKVNKTESANIWEGVLRMNIKTYH